MAHATLTFDSALLHRPVSCGVLMPENAAPRGLLVYLHGFSDRYDSVLHYSSLERYLLGVPLAVVMPDAQCSFYMDTAFGQPYWEHITREIPGKLLQWLNLDIPRERSFVAGVSMGGYGACKMALQCPERFSEAFLFTPLMDMAQVARAGFDRSIDPAAPAMEDLHMDSLLGGREIRGTSDDLFYLLDQSDPAALPRFTLYTGTDDFLYAGMLKMADAMKAKGADFEMHTSPGTHCWYTWDPFMAQMAAKIAAAL